ncbi:MULTISPECIES: hypothetical protein [unclassified Microcystis]|uniref:hypothetical protein n=1 Tax=unclassified Microcystis TaxID=2643300 RepID=UPI0011965290|nr:MAG: hypothetical protein EWV67_17610 [Microcystis sp. M_QC_C_20170808_M2Col]TRT67960.1 MAG: hypothetical protein EWV68_11885 [Microcystis sp. M_QC_C_20170808_M9Col]
MSGIFPSSKNSRQRKLRQLKGLRLYYLLDASNPVNLRVIFKLTPFNPICGYRLWLKVIY